MPSHPPRRGPRKLPVKAPPINQELADLAAVIAEHTLDNNAYGWFRTPWRDGWNAVELAHDLPGQHVRNSWSVTEATWLGRLMLTDPQAHERRLWGNEMYWMAEDELRDTMDPMMRAALRCLQVLVANSSGGGHAYNAILIPAFLHVNPAGVVDDILERRCHDSIGTTARLQGDPNDRLRGAFRTAWSRGLYLAAYSLPPATVAGQMRSTAHLKEIK
jgi:hypothetical protein